jgi:hypothetical protein
MSKSMIHQFSETKTIQHPTENQKLQKLKFTTDFRLVGIVLLFSPSFLRIEGSSSHSSTVGYDVRCARYVRYMVDCAKVTFTLRETRRTHTV